MCKTYFKNFQILLKAGGILAKILVVKEIIAVIFQFLLFFILGLNVTEKALFSQAKDKSTFFVISIALIILFLNVEAILEKIIKKMVAIKIEKKLSILMLVKQKQHLQLSKFKFEQENQNVFDTHISLMLSVLSLLTYTYIIIMYSLTPMFITFLIFLLSAYIQFNTQKKHKNVFFLNNNIFIIQIVATAFLFFSSISIFYHLQGGDYMKFISLRVIMKAILAFTYMMLITKKIPTALKNIVIIKEDKIYKDKFIFCIKTFVFS